MCTTNPLGTLVFVADVNKLWMLRGRMKIEHEIQNLVSLGKWSFVRGGY